MYSNSPEAKQECLEAIEELGGITVSHSQIHHQIYVYNCRDEVLFLLDSVDLKNFNDEDNDDMTNDQLAALVLDQYEQEVLDALVEKEYC